MGWVLVVVRRPRFVAQLLVGLVGAVLYVWYASVRAVPEVRRRKAALRADRARTWRA